MQAAREECINEQRGKERNVYESMMNSRGHNIHIPHSGVATPGPARARARVTSVLGPGNNYFGSGLKFNCMRTWRGRG